MKLGYGTWALQNIPLEEVIPGLAEIGFDAVALAVAPEAPTAPANLNEAARKHLRALFRKHKLPAPVLVATLAPLAPDDEHAELRAQFQALCHLAGDLHFGTGPAVITTTLGAEQPEWEAGRARICQRLRELARLAAAHQVVLAVGPSYDGALDRPEKIEWLLREVNERNLRCNFDISQFAAQGLEVEACIRTCVPLAAYAQVKDSVGSGSDVQFVLPGDGDFDYPSYMVAMKQAGYQGVIAADVGAAVWGAEDYDPWEAAEYCFEVLNEAREVALMGWD